MASRNRGAVEHGHLLGAVAEGDVAVRQEVRRGSGSGNGRHRVLVVYREVGRVEPREGASPFRMNPAHAGTEFTDSVDGILHQGERSLAL